MTQPVVDRDEVEVGEKDDRDHQEVDAEQREICEMEGRDCQEEEGPLTHSLDQENEREPELHQEGRAAVSRTLVLCATS